jgi:epoxyqueuosine reductase
MMSSAALKQRILALGFTRVGIMRAKPSPMVDMYLRWLDAGMHGEMAYLERVDHLRRRHDFSAFIPDVRSIVVVALDYRDLDVADTMLADPLRGRIASYAWGQDYHEIMTPRLMQLESELHNGRAYVDTGAIMERSHGQTAGLGFIGKNTMLIHPRRGSYFFLGEIITPAEFDTYDEHPTPKSMCGSCTRCLQACPTDAFPRPFVLDARRCISYLTIEHKSAIPLELRHRMGNWVFGCDICQDVCPFQRFATSTTEPLLIPPPPSAARAAPLLTDLLGMTSAEFNAHFKGSSVVRITHARMVRNACVAAGNALAAQHPAASALIPHLTRWAHGDDTLIAEHARWALAQASPSR